MWLHLTRRPEDRTEIDAGEDPDSFHRTPNRKKFSKKEWDNFTQESTPHALAELASSPKFTDWIIKHADRIQLLPDYSSDNTIGSGSNSTDENLVESGDRFSLFKW
ncbi:hypothetical protein CsSME_00046223 [Camellia sinensis var. sinensis]